jgi:hypothetical protein
VPRGGECISCREYTLWGDVIRGCYRRSASGATPVAEGDIGANGEISGSNDDVHPTITQNKSKAKKASTELPVSHRKVGRPRKVVVTEAPGTKQPRAARTQKAIVATSDGSAEFYDLNAISSDEEEDGVPYAPTPQGQYTLPETGPSRVPASLKRPVRVGPTTTIRNHHTNADDREFFDLNAISSDSEEDRAPPPPTITPRITRTTFQRNATPGPSRLPSKPLPQSIGGTGKRMGLLRNSDNREFFDLNAISSDNEDDGVPAAPKSTYHGLKAGSRPTRMEHPPTNIFPSSSIAIYPPPSDYMAVDSDIDTHLARSPKISTTSSSPIQSIPHPRLSPTPIRRPTKSKKRILAKPGEVDFFNVQSRTMPDSDDASPGLVRALSTLSISSPQGSSERRPMLESSEGMDVIEISD